MSKKRIKKRLDALEKTTVGPIHVSSRVVTIGDDGIEDEADDDLPEDARLVRTQSPLVTVHRID